MILSDKLFTTDPLHSLIPNKNLHAMEEFGRYIDSHFAYQHLPNSFIALLTYLTVRLMPPQANLLKNALNHNALLTKGVYMNPG